MLSLNKTTTVTLNTSVNVYTGPEVQHAT